MDTIKIGKYIAENRKKKRLTQAQLAEKLGVNSKTISRWENGNYMPDISLLKPLSEELGISLNDLLSGETVKHEHYQDKLEENILNTIDYTNKKSNGLKDVSALIFFALGIVVTIAALIIIPSENVLGGFHIFLGIIITLIGVVIFTKRLIYWKRILISFCFFIFSVLLLIGTDYIGVVSMHQAPRFAISVTSTAKSIYYDTLFYDVLRINPNSDEEVFSILPNQNYDNYDLYQLENSAEE